MSVEDELQISLNQSEDKPNKRVDWLTNEQARRESAMKPTWDRRGTDVSPYRGGLLVKGKHRAWTSNFKTNKLNGDKLSGVYTVKPRDNLRRQSSNQNSSHQSEGCLNFPLELLLPPPRNSSDFKFQAKFVLVYDAAFQESQPALKSQGDQCQTTSYMVGLIRTGNF